MTKKIKLIVLLSALIIFAKIIFMGWYAYLYYHAPLIKQGKAESIKISPNSDIHALAINLYQRNLFHNPQFFIFMSRRNGQAPKLRYGEYWIKPGMSASKLLDNIVQGKGLVRHHVTFIEGWTFADIKKLLSSDVNLKQQLNGKTDQQIMVFLKTSSQKPEGLFFPSTYFYLWGDSDADVLQKALKKMQTFLQIQWQAREKGLPYRTPYDALIVASLIEKETAIDNERATIAGVILNRLKHRMRLQVDPTVLYGLGKSFNTEITKKDLLSKNSYNTYYIYGLPPTPISMPSAGSITAALHPQTHAYLYYVARGDGSHHFSETYKEHLNAVKKYQAKMMELKKEIMFRQQLPMQAKVNARVIKQ